MNINFRAIGGRKFFLVLGCGVISTLLFKFGPLSEQGYITLILATVAAYITSNTVESMKSNNTSEGQ